MAAALASGQDLAQAPAADLLADYQALRTAALDPSHAAAVENFELKKDSATFLLKSGHLCFLQPVAGHVTGAVFIGDGTFTIKPPLEIERNNLALFNDGKPELAEPFKAAVFVFSNETAFDGLKATVQAAPPGAAGELNDFRDLFRDDLSTNIHARILADLAFPARAMFLAEIRGDNHGRLIFSFDPDSREEVELVAFKPKDYFDRWCEYRPGGAKLEAKDIVDTQKITIDTTLDGTKLSGETRIEYTPLIDGPRVLPMSLAYSLRVSKVTAGDGAELKFIQEDKKKDSDLWVILPAPLKKGVPGVLTVTYAGDDVVQSAGSGNFYVGARTSWYASIRSGEMFNDRAVYNMTFRVPKKFQVIATGRKVSERDEAKQTISEWTTDIPYTVAGFNYGRYKQKTVTDGGVEISVYANPGTNDDLQAIKHYADSNQHSGITVGGLTTTGMVDRQIAEAINSLRVYTKFFGEMPYKTLSITQQPSGFYGQSWPTLVFLPYTALLDNTMKNQLGLLDSASSRQFFNEVGSHEIAHQWWGHMMAWADYHDQWLSEGFAQYSSAIYTQYVEGDGNFRTFMDRQKREILETQPPNTKPLVEAGPIWLGYRLESKKFQGGGQLIYAKGAYVLHMLRMMMYDISSKDDTRFAAMMRDFMQTYQGKSVTTEDFKRICDKHFGQDMSWFFNQWVYGTATPKVNVQYSTPQRGADTYFVSDISLADVPPDFEVTVPVVFRMKQGAVSGRIRVKGKAHIEAKLPGVPDSVEFDPYRAILGDLEVKKL